MNVLVSVLLLVGPVRGQEAGTPARLPVVIGRDASPMERLAAREVVRYTYLRTGRVLRIVAASALPPGEAIVVATKRRALARKWKGDPVIAALGPQEFVLRTVGAPRQLFLLGGDGVGTLYAAYRFAERLGVRFYLHGDTIPDRRVRLALPDLDEVGKPLFALRGIQPFHDFPEGPDWWNRDDYLAYVAQLAKLRMNFVGLHCYPEGGAGPEPAVWIGLPADCDEQGRVAFAYPAQWASTVRGGAWGYAPMKTSDFCGGAAQLFPGDDYGPEVLAEMLPRPTTPVDCNRLFNRVGTMYRAVFAAARALGVKTCLGTETPLTIPELVRKRLKKQGKNPADAAVVTEVYRGVFQRIARLCPIDYYWLWTPESWTWGGTKPGQFAATVRDLRCALAALDSLGNPFTLAVCGWVLGPVNDRTAFDRILPESCPVSCINRWVGHAPVEPAFARITGRPKWAIPWLENDPNLTAPQPWVGRMRYDAADARRLGCTGLFGIHWRTKAVAVNVAALAAAGWEQPWVPAEFLARRPETRLEVKDGPLGGNVAAFAAPVADTDDDPVYQTVRYNMDGYNLTVPKGTYTVTLQFNEPFYTAPGKRVFGATVQGKQVIEHLDLFARLGRNHAFDLRVPNVRVTGDRLSIRFTREVEFPCIAGITVAGRTAPARQSASRVFVRKVNCGGPRYRDYEADLSGRDRAEAQRRRTMPADDFYRDFAEANFGETIAEAAAEILAAIDGAALPEPCGWQQGPGAVRVDTTPWKDVQERYAFVDKLAALRDRVRGAGNLRRFDSCLDTYRAARALAHVGCLRGELDRLMKQVAAARGKGDKQRPVDQALAVRTELARSWQQAISYQTAAADTPGELGTLANLEQHTRKQLKFLTSHDGELTAALGRPLPAAATPGHAYLGSARLAVPTLRSLAAPGESLKIRVFVLVPGDAPRTTEGALFWRPLGHGPFTAVPLRHVGRSVFEAVLPPAPANVFAVEYYVEATGDNKTLRFPPTAPRLNQTVVTTEALTAGTGAS